MYLRFVSVTVSLPIAFKAVSVLGDYFDEDLGSIFSTHVILTRICHSFCCLTRLANSLLKLMVQLASDLPVYKSR